MFCDDCQSQIKWVTKPICLQCGRPQSSEIEKCFECQADPLPLGRVRSAITYQDPVRRVLHRMKYEGYYSLAQPLGELMARAWPRWQHPFDLVLPVPLHTARRRQRGYNQAEILVRQLQENLNWPIETAALVRSRKTRPQLGLTAAERRANVLGAFRADPTRIASKRILLVDDVFTTGSTLAAAAAALLDAGATRVTAYCLTCAADRQDITIV